MLTNTISYFMEQCTPDPCAASLYETDIITEYNFDLYH